MSDGLESNTANIIKITEEYIGCRTHLYMPLVTNLDPSLSFGSMLKFPNWLCVSAQIPMAIPNTNRSIGIRLKI